MPRCVAFVQGLRQLAREKKLFKSQECLSRFLKTKILRLGQVYVSKLSNTTSTQIPKTAEERGSSRPQCNHCTFNFNFFLVFGFLFLLRIVRIDRC